MVKVSQYQKSWSTKKVDDQPQLSPLSGKSVLSFQSRKSVNDSDRFNLQQDSTLFRAVKATLLAWFSDDGKKQVHGRMPWLLRKTHLGTPKWMVKIMENPIKRDDLGGKPHYFWKHPSGLPGGLFNWFFAGIARTEILIGHKTKEISQKLLSSCPDQQQLQLISSPGRTPSQ